MNFIQDEPTFGKKDKAILEAYNGSIVNEEVDVIIKWGSDGHQVATKRDNEEEVKKFIKTLTPNPSKIKWEGKTKVVLVMEDQLDEAGFGLNSISTDINKWKLEDFAKNLLQFIGATPVAKDNNKKKSFIEQLKQVISNLDKSKPDVGKETTKLKIDPEQLKQMRDKLK